MGNEKPTSPKVEEVTSNDNADLLLSQLKESNASFIDLTEEDTNSGTKPAYRKKLMCPKMTLF